MRDEVRGFLIEKNIPIGLLNSPIGPYGVEYRKPDQFSAFFKAKQLLMPPILERQLKIDFHRQWFLFDIPAWYCFADLCFKEAVCGQNQISRTRLAKPLLLPALIPV